MSNRLALERSPYLLQHADNPVDWYPWGPEAFTKAQRERKPIFLSIGYSTCHWCHVMEHESFEKSETAAILNAHFVSIKVDREERPDVDRVYMAAVQTMTGSGGWPMSVFLTPSLTPFYGGTYFPPADMYGRPGFPTVLERIRQVWADEQEQLEASGAELLAVLRERNDANEEHCEPSEALLSSAYDTIAASYDEEHGGFGHGAKFPRPVLFEFLFRYAKRTGSDDALRIALTSLLAMSSGGMYDHLGGGFHRYSVDPQWRVPHFEKMLYDQAQLIRVYTDAFEITHDDVFAAVARDTIEYVLRDMTDERGGFYSAEDADSADLAHTGALREGAFYVWQQEELEAVLSADESKIFCEYYSVAAEGNVVSDPHGDFRGRNILFAPRTLEQAAARCGMTTEDADVHLAAARHKVFAFRALRPRPLRDDKIIAGWNGLMIGALARAAAVLHDERCARAAVRAAEFLMESLCHGGDSGTGVRNMLYRRYRGGDASLEGHLDDYAAVVDGMLELHRLTQDPRWLDAAETLSGTQEALFWDAARGGFYESSGADPSVLVRMKEMYDGAEPAGNSLAARNLVRLSRMTGAIRYQALARSTIGVCCAQIRQVPHMMPLLLCAVDEWLQPPDVACTDGACALPDASPAR